MIEVSWGAPINPDKLNKELEVSFPDAGVTWDQAVGVIFVEGVEESDRAAVEAIIGAHDHTQKTQSQLDREAAQARVASGKGAVNAANMAQIRANIVDAGGIPALNEKIDVAMQFLQDLADALGFTPTTE